MQDNLQSISKSAIRLLSGTFLSRCSGMTRDLSMAYCFGAHPAVAAFMVAFRFANLIRRLFGESALPSAFIPHFEGLRAESPEKGTQFFRDLFASMTVFLAALISVMEGGLLLLLRWGGLSESAADIVRMTMLMLPGVLFICLFGLSSALLHCEKKFFLSGVAPIAFNIVWIMTVWWLKGYAAPQAMLWLSGSIILAFAMQWLITMPGYWRLLFQRVRVVLFSKEVRLVMRSLFLTVIGVGAVQINNAVDGVFARFASLEGPAYLWYAIRLQQLPLALFGVALSSVLLPPLSRAEPTEQDALLMYGLKRSFSLMMPCTIGTLVLGCTSINLLYGRGDFSQEATYQTIICLWGYGLGLIPSVFVLLLAPSFYAQKNYKTPALFSVMSVVVNMVFNGLFVFLFKWGPLSIALATSLGAFFNLWLLMRKKNLKISLEVWVHFGKIFCISCLAGSTVLCLGLFLKDPTWAVLQGKEVVFSRHLQEQIVQCGTLTACYAFLVWGMILLSKKFSRIYE